ncbi:MAG: pilT [Bacillales bacterium]|jgi:twitching motility protein PilT|nr:pilT [Bacillales bacterium]
MNINELLRTARERHCSDVHLTSKRNPVFRIDGDLQESEFILTPEERHHIILQMLDESQKQIVLSGSDLDFSYALSNGDRHRVNIYHQQKHLAATLRVINNTIPNFDELGLPEALRKMADEPRGLVLITGPTGSGKSTTLAAMIDYINSNKAKHILTVEDPIEYVYSHKNSLVHQREVGTDVESFSTALRSALREDPDVILVGEMRDYETISAAVTAAETGHLVFATLHTIGAADTVNRIIDVFSPHQQQQIRTQLSAVLKGVVTQQLLKRADGTGRVAAFEIMTGTDAVLNLIREDKCHQLEGTIQISKKAGMTTLDSSLVEMVMNRVVTLEAALEKAKNKSNFDQFITKTH